MKSPNWSAHIPEPKFARFLFGSSRISWVWAILRIYIGYEWLMAGWGKVTSAAWTGANAGAAVSGFLTGSLQKTAGAHPDVSGWYAAFIENFASQHTVFLSYLVAYGEVAVGIALVLGAFTGIAAFFGIFMNVNYLFAGTVSTNPFLLLIQLFLILAWRNAGWLGLDRWLLPLFGTPWEHGDISK
jgi:thiosulfate dehydrogenase [quinone] large subunit